MLRDILLSRHVPMDANIIRSELSTDHRVRIPPNSVGAELGVFTGLLSSHLAKHPKIASITFIDPWWALFGERYPDWGSYTDFGRIKTRAAYAAAERRILQHRMPNRVIEVTSSYDWLAAQADESLDWVYLDTTHTYEGTKQELALLKRKVRDGGFILGDDWHDEGHIHHGVSVAVNEFLKDSQVKVILCGRESQWVLRKGSNATGSVGTGDTRQAISEP
jgi:hypothetical protein